MDGTDRPYPRVMNHVGLAVPDLDAAIAWYGRVLGFELFSGPVVLAVDDEQSGPLVRELAPGVRSMRLAHLATGGGAGLELFQFLEPPAEPGAAGALPPSAGFFHICVTDPDPDALAGRIAAAGGRRRTRLWPGMGGDPYRFVYTEDPWGNLIEVFSHAYQLAFGNLGRG